MSVRLQKGKLYRAMIYTRHGLTARVIVTAQDQTQAKATAEAWVSEHGSISQVTRISVSRVPTITDVYYFG